jgi:hypothetical protein
MKPANVLIADRGGSEHAYLSDFGLTKSGSLTSGLTAAGQFLWVASKQAAVSCAAPAAA